MVHQMQIPSWALYYCSFKQKCTKMLHSEGKRYFCSPYKISQNPAIMTQIRHNHSCPDKALKTVYSSHCLLNRIWRQFTLLFFFPPIKGGKIHISYLSSHMLAPMWYGYPSHGFTALTVNPKDVAPTQLQLIDDGSVLMGRFWNDLVTKNCTCNFDKIFWCNI